MNIKTFLSNFLLERSAKQKHVVTHSRVFETGQQSILFILPFNDKNDIQKIKLSQSCKDHFRKISFLSIDISATKSFSNESVLYSNQLDFRGHIKKNHVLKPAIDPSYDAVVNFLPSTVPTIDLFLNRISAQLKIRFDRNNEIFYNFIVPIEDMDVSVRFEHFLKIYQTLKK